MRHRKKGPTSQAVMKALRNLPLDPKLDMQQQQELKTLLLNYSDIFALETKDLGKTNVINHKIPTGSTKPIRIPRRKLPHHLQTPVLQELEKMMEAGIIQHTRSPWSFPIVVVGKKEGGVRICTD